VRNKLYIRDDLLKNGPEFTKKYFPDLFLCGILYWLDLGELFYDCQLNNVD
jgi:hypothetical protein